MGGKEKESRWERERERGKKTSLKQGSVWQRNKQESREYKEGKNETLEELPFVSHDTAAGLHRSTVSEAARPATHRLLRAR